MKFFTRDWAEGRPSPEACEETRRAYWSHVGRVPAPAAELATAVNFHDAIIRRVRVDRRAGELRIDLRCGDEQAGYFDAVLQYSGVPVEETDLAVLADRARDPETEVLYDEVDVDPEGRPCHRFLYWPDGELEIRFASFALSRIPKERRVEPRPEAVYSEGPIDRP